MTLAEKIVSNVFQNISMITFTQGVSHYIFFVMKYNYNYFRKNVVKYNYSLHLYFWKCSEYTTTTQY